MEQKVETVQVMKTLECAPDLHLTFKLFAIQADKPMKQLTEQFLREGMERYQDEQQETAA